MGPRSTAPNIVSPFSRCLGLLRRGPAQGPRPGRHTRPGGVCHGPCSWAGYAPPSCTRRRTHWPGLAGVACSGERHTLQTLKPGGFNQWLPTTQNPQRNSGSEPSKRPFGKTRSAGSPITTSPFRGSTPRGPVEDHAELPFRQPAFRCQARRPGTHTHCRAQGRGGPGGWRQQSQLSAAPSSGGLNRVAFFPWTPVPARGRGALSETITA